MSASHHVGAIIARIGESVKRYRDLLWQLLLCALIGWSAYNVGRIRAQQSSQAYSVPLIEPRAAIVSQTTAPTGRGSVVGTDRSDPRVVVSKTSSSKKYHFSWCASGLRIKEENRVWYPTAAAAQAAGYSLAGNCSE